MQSGTSHLPLRIAVIARRHSLCFFSIHHRREIKKKTRQLSDLIVSLQELVHIWRCGHRIRTGREMNRIGKEFAQRFRRQVDEPDSGKNAQDKDDGNQIDLSTNGPLNVEGDQIRVHPDMHDPSKAGQDGTANFYKVAHAGQMAIYGSRVKWIACSDLIGNARDKRVRQEFAGFVRDVDVNIRLSHPVKMDSGTPYAH